MGPQGLLLGPHCRRGPSRRADLVFEYNQSRPNVTLTITDADLTTRTTAPE